MSNQDVRKSLELFLENNPSIKQAAIARALGISSATISQYLAGKYQGDNGKLDKDIRALLQRQAEKSMQTKVPFKFIKTRNSKKYFEAARICHIDNDMGLAVGAAGSGKTAAAKEYASGDSDVILVEADMGYTARDLFRELHQKLGGEGKGTIHDLLEDCVSRLIGTGRLIIVDEAEHLPYRALDSLRRVHDKAEVGILLAGMPRLLENIRGQKGEYAQLHSRIGMKVILKDLDPVDTETVVKNAHPEANDFWKVFHEKSGANMRVLKKLIKRAVRLSEINEKPINAEIIEEARLSLVV